jgi:hypothetical protein
MNVNSPRSIKKLLPDSKNLVHAVKRSHLRVSNRSNFLYSHSVAPFQFVSPILGTVHLLWIISWIWPIWWEIESNDCSFNYRFSGYVHHRGLSVISLTSCSVSISIRVAIFIVRFLSLHPCQFAERKTSHWRAIASGLRYKQYPFKNLLLISVSVKASTSYLSDGSVFNPWNLSIWSNETPGAHGIVS